MPQKRPKTLKNVRCRTTNTMYFDGKNIFLGCENQLQKHENNDKRHKKGKIEQRNLKAKNIPTK